MIPVASIIGNAHDVEWTKRLHNATIDWLDLDQWQAQKNRFRATTERGLELGISLDRGSHLRDGDILVWDESACKAVATRISLQDVMIVQIGSLLAQTPEVLARTCFELGHALGNQHWPAVVKGTQVFVPLTVDRAVMASVMKTHNFASISYEFVAGTQIIPYLAPHEARRLFGGAEATPHSHVHSHTPSHERDHDHSHDHDHDHGRGH